MSEPFFDDADSDSSSSSHEGLPTSTVVVALLVHYLVVYTVLLKLLTKVPWRVFARAMVPAQLLAFSSSSSAATLPVTMDCLENQLKVPRRVTDFVLPIGATVNMDGTALYEGVAVIFLIILSGLLYATNKRLWAPVKGKEEA